MEERWLTDVELLVLIVLSLVIFIKIALTVNKD
jgi:hypothetical protein